MGENGVKKHIEDAIEIMVAAGTASNVILGTATLIVQAWKMAFPGETSMTVPEIAQSLRAKAARNVSWGKDELARLDAIIAAQ